MYLLWYACNSSDAGTSIDLGGRDQDPTRHAPHASEQMIKLLLELIEPTGATLATRRFFFRSH